MALFEGHFSSLSLLGLQPVICLAVFPAGHADLSDAVLGVLGAKLCKIQFRIEKTPQKGGGNGGGMTCNHHLEAERLTPKICLAAFSPARGHAGPSDAVIGMLEAKL